MVYISKACATAANTLCSGFEAEIWFGKHKGGDLYSVAHTTVLWHLVLALVVSLTRCRPLFYNLLQDDQVVHKCSNLTSDSFLFFVVSFALSFALVSFVLLYGLPLCFSFCFSFVVHSVALSVAVACSFVVVSFAFSFIVAFVLSFAFSFCSLVCCSYVHWCLYATKVTADS